MNLKNTELKQIITFFIILGIAVGLITPTLELFNIITSSNKIVISIEVLLISFFLVQALVVKNGERWKHALLLSLPVLLADIFARIFNLYQKVEGFGYFGHFWIGIALTAILVLIYNKQLKFIASFNISVA
ncbi:MAG: hypothetical protein Q8P81_03070, partial [Nanoarchaeota archaeon]|nr:hypothetical protein [Nanoarchaeota archaeon]